MFRKFLTFCRMTLFWQMYWMTCLFYCHINYFKDNSNWNSGHQNHKKEWNQEKRTFSIIPVKQITHSWEGHSHFTIRFEKWTSYRLGVNETFLSVLDYQNQIKLQYNLICTTDEIRVYISVSKYNTPICMTKVLQLMCSLEYQPWLRELPFTLHWRVKD